MINVNVYLYLQSTVIKNYFNLYEFIFTSFICDEFDDCFVVFHHFLALKSDTVRAVLITNVPAVTLGVHATCGQQ